MSERVVVVGAGIIGLWTAYEVQRRGLDVVVIDKGRLGAGSSVGNAGWVIPARTLPMPAPGLHWEGLKMMVKPDSPLYIKPTALPRLTGWFTQFLKYCNTESYRRGCEAMASLSAHAHADYDRLLADGLEFEMHERGLLSVFLNDEALQAGYNDHQVMGCLGLGRPVRLTARETKELNPELSPDVVGGVYLTEARHVNPGTLLDALFHRLRERGTEFRFDTEVRRLVRENDRVVGAETTGETVFGDHIVLAAGAWTGGLVKSLGFSLPMQAGKGYSISLKPPSQSVGSALFLGEAKIAVTPLNDSTRFAGTIEFSGINLHVEKQRIESLHKWIPQYLPNYDASAAGNAWVGMRPVTPDGLPVIGRVPNFPNVYIASGHSTAGLSLAPRTAVRIADLVFGGTSPDPDPFDPARFG